MPRINWSKAKTKDNVRKSNQEFSKSMQPADRIHKRSMKKRAFDNLEKRTGMVFTPDSDIKRPQVAKINWVQDTPKSLTIQFMRWQDRRNNVR